MTSNKLLDDRLTTAIEAAEAAGREIKRLRSEHAVSVSFKSDRNLVTTADINAEKIILDIIKSKAPNAKFLAEESFKLEATPPDFSGEWWIIDPVDGTTNYAYSQPQVGVSIAMAIDGVTQVGVVYSPFQSELFHATLGQGSFLNNKPISVSGCQALSDALIGTGFPYERDTVDEVTAQLGRVLKRCRDVRRAGAASLDICWLACSRLDGFYESLAPWDIAAGSLIAREAGATVGNFDLKSKPNAAWPKDLRSTNFLAANPRVYEELMEIL